MIQIKVELDPYNPFEKWMAYDENMGLDFSWEGEENGGWRNTGSKIGTGKTIQDAIENFLDCFDEELNYKWS